MEFCYQKKAEKVVETEAKGQKSIVYRSLNLLHALKQYGVMPAIINIVLNKYIESNIRKFMSFPMTCGNMFCLRRIMIFRELLQNNT